MSFYEVMSLYVSVMRLCRDIISPSVTFRIPNFALANYLLP